MMKPPECPPVSWERGKCAYPGCPYPAWEDGGGFCPRHAHTDDPPCGCEWAEFDDDGVMAGRVEFVDVEPAPTDEDTQPGEVWLPLGGHSSLWLLDEE